MNEDFNLDDLKDSWKSQSIQKEVSHEDVMHIINKKSRNNVYGVLIVSIIEFTFGIISLGYLQYKDLVFEPNQAFQKIKDIDDFMFYYKMYNILYVIGFICFILIFYFSYKKLATNLSVKQYITQIIRFRRWANVFIFWNLFLGALFTFGTLGFGLYEAVVIVENTSNIVISPKKLMLLTVGIFIFSIFSLLVTWGIYRLIYGTFLIRLKKNIHDLQQLNH